jgi:hypothetical protein
MWGQVARKCYSPGTIFSFIQYTVCHKSTTIAKVLDSTQLNVMCRSDLTGPRFASWNAWLPHLELIHLTQEADEFGWNLHENDRFSLHYIYRALVQPGVPINSNKNKNKNFLENPLTTKVFAWYLHRRVLFTRDNPVKRNWHRSLKYVFCHHDETIKYLFFYCKLAIPTWSIIQVVSNLYHPWSVPNICGNWLYSVDHSFTILIRVWSFWLCRNDNIKMLLSGRLSTSEHLSHDNCLYSEWRIETFL